MANRLFTLTLAGALLLGTGGAALAQDNPPATQGQGPWGHGQRQMDPEQELQRLTKQLDLSADQQSRIKPLLVERRQKMQALFEDQSLSREDHRAKADSIRDETHGKILAVLNEEQKQKFDAMRGHKRNRGGDGQPAAPAESPQP
ncbi:MAG: hypothetical protein WBM14_11750 [Terracidiphilus sp.]